ncbi:replication factor C small subunit / DNA polymerase clamp loader subunit [Proteus phage PM2]|uniref:Sliding-clamp-loader large subunit n=2 Tax=Bragavirus TaxID=2948639 RepID=A0A0G2SSU9_9CAUD|nr:clamp loader of DNA polymerase [Proteus phage vB_PmiM_Pm5461]YP_010091921.1 clamp loader of DNA polymerase [Proteus phage PM2]AKA61910.1 DNA polymerase accessory protein clamp loader subunit [Proteus phage vB_PmiM_Pm5461]ASZ76313.1 replication factor C small subunit / DNA polymerase clamp loader subunit [Proteus phage PM2]
MISINKDEFMFEQKYRPQTIDECILPKHDKETFNALIKKGRIPHLILTSPSPGTGKTTTALILAKQTNSEYMFVNGADCKIDFIRTQLTPFASSGSLEGRNKIIIIDEFDRAGLGDAQRHLRSFMETYSKNCSIIITANNLDGIIKPLQSRARVIKFTDPSDEDKISMMRDMIKRCVEICKAENIEVEDIKILAHLVKQNFPDLRKTVNELDIYSVNGKIDTGILGRIVDKKSQLDDVITALQTKNIKDLRVLAIKYAPDFKTFILQLANELYPLLKPVGVVHMYETVGDANKFFGLASNTELLLMSTFVSLAVGLTWNV